MKWSRTGKMAHSAYPELGDSAIDKLLDALAAIRNVQLPVDDLLGPSTLNIGTIHGGRAPNVIPDEARAEIFIRLVGDSAATRAALERRPSAGNGVELNEVLEIPRASGSPPWKASHHRGRLHHRYSGFRRRLGAAAAARPRNHSRGAHARGARARSSSFSKQSKSIKKWSGKLQTAMKQNRSRYSRRHRHGGPAFHQISRRSSVVRAHVAGRERALRRQALSRSREMASRRRRARMPSPTLHGRRSEAGQRAASCCSPPWTLPSPPKSSRPSRRPDTWWSRIRRTTAWIATCRCSCPKSIPII